MSFKKHAGKCQEGKRDDVNDVRVCVSGKQLWEPCNVLSISAHSDGEIGRIISLAHFFYVAACGLSPLQNICSVFINTHSLPTG